MERFVVAALCSPLAAGLAQAITGVILAPWVVDMWALFKDGVRPGFDSAGVARPFLVDPAAGSFIAWLSIALYVVIPLAVYCRTLREV